jgi:hypothetical protein
MRGLASGGSDADVAGAKASALISSRQAPHRAAVLLHAGVVYPEVKAEVRAILAKHIIAAAMHGERDHARWRSTGLGSIKSDAPDPLRPAPGRPSFHDAYLIEQP